MSSSSSSSSFINSFKYIPRELFRVNNGRYVALREWSVRRSRSYDLLTEAGRVKPKALDPRSYQAPNGASMRPNGDYQMSLVERFQGRDVIVYSVAEGTALPDNLILVHEYSDHYSLQPAIEMTVDQLNQSITSFFESNGTVYTRDQWLATYRASAQNALEENAPLERYQASQSTPAGVSYSASSSAYPTTPSGCRVSYSAHPTTPSGYAASAAISGQSSSSTDEYWTWSTEYSRYYHIHDDGSCEWYDGEASSSSSTQKSGSRGHVKSKGKRH